MWRLCQLLHKRLQTWRQPLPTCFQLCSERQTRICREMCSVSKASGLAAWRSRQLSPTPQIQKPLIYVRKKCSLEIEDFVNQKVVSRLKIWNTHKFSFLDWNNMYILYIYIHIYVYLGHFTVQQNIANWL